MTPDSCGRTAWPSPGLADPAVGERHVAKVGLKIFAFMGADTVGLKCGATREEADEWLAPSPTTPR